ncbi:MAG: alpha/beta fold hydrolase [Gammaproteobacteria bacterium]|nr:alpha/beta fold hydrolase [Gammaproteobacteria bacterium]
MTRKLLDKIEITTGDTIDYCVIWLHGLGASGHDFEPVVPELHLLQRPGVRFIFPHAPVRPITINGGASMRGWYDITSLDFDQREQDIDGTEDSAIAVRDLINDQIAQGVPAEHIILAGFSQGGAVALYTALTHTEKLGGVLALSTYLPLHVQVREKLSAVNTGMPILMAHGTADDVINIRHAESSREVLKQLGIDVEWHAYPIAHSVSLDEIEEVSRWLKRLFGM